MTDAVIENPILNSPYQEPTRHFRFDDKVAFPSHRGHVHQEEKAMAEKRRKFDRDFRDGAFRTVLDSRRPIAAVARDLGIDDGTLGNLVKKARADSEPGALKEDEISPAT